MKVSPLKQLAVDSVHGGLLKSLALISRIGFFVLVMPILAEGELATYVFIGSTALLAAMVLVLGLDEELPRVVAGDVEIAKNYRGVFVTLSILSLVALFGMAIHPNKMLSIILFAMVITTGRYLGGLVRGLDAAVFERLINLPWLIFIVVVLALRFNVAYDLIIVMSVSMMTVQAYCFFSLGIHKKSHCEESRTPTIKLVKSRMVEGIPRLVSNLFFFGTIRGALLWPVWLSVDAELDEIALAIAVGEVVSQFGLIPVNRTYVRWCKNPPTRLSDWRYALIQGAMLSLLLTATSLIGLYVLARLNWLPHQINSLMTVSMALLYYSLVPVFWLFRYLLWSRALSSIWIAGVSLAQFLISGLIVVLVGPDYWFVALSGLLILVCMIIAAQVRTAFQAVDA